MPSPLAPSGGAFPEKSTQTNGTHITAIRILSIESFQRPRSAVEIDSEADPASYRKSPNERYGQIHHSADHEHRKDVLDFDVPAFGGFAWMSRSPPELSSAASHRQGIRHRETDDGFPRSAATKKRRHI